MEKQGEHAPHTEIPGQEATQDLLRNCTTVLPRPNAILTSLEMINNQTKKEMYTHTHTFH